MVSVLVGIKDFIFYFVINNIWTKSDSIKFILVIMKGITPKKNQQTA